MNSEIAEEYSIWRKNAEHNYDLIVTHALSWPSLTCQFFPTCDRLEDSSVQNILLCTHTSNVDREYILIAGISFPDSYSEDMQADNRIRMVMEIPVSDEVNRARYSPFAFNIIATRSDTPHTAVYDTTRHNCRSKVVAQPDLLLAGHKKGGFGLSWSITSNGMVATTGEDHLCLVYNINHKGDGQAVEASFEGSRGADTKPVSTIGPITVVDKHSAVVNDCCFSYFHDNILYSVGDDRKIVASDMRGGSSITENVHDSDILCIHCSPIEQNLIATGSKDSCAKVWDLRNMKEPLCTFRNENNEILQVQFSPHLGSYLATGGTDRRVRIWDINEVGKEFVEDNDGPPELKFLHSGHTNSVCDLSWNPLEPMEICSVAEDNIMQIWQCTMSNLEFDLD